MSIVNFVLLSLVFCLLPAGVLWLCDRVRIIGKIGPVLTLYFIGIIIGNIGLMPNELPLLQDVFSNAMIPLAIPLMLFSCRFDKSGTKSGIMALVTGILAVTIAVTCGYLLLGEHIPESAKVGGMMLGVYTGGTINLAALKTMLGASDETYILLNSYDMIVSFLYFTFLLAGGIRLFRKILPNTSNISGEAISEGDLDTSNPYKGLFTRGGMKDAGCSLGVTLLICAISGGVALALPDSLFMTVFILMLTTLGLVCSFVPSVRNRKYSFDIGMYFIYIFCIAVASMADFTKIDWLGSLYLLGYLLIAVFGSLLIHTILARIFRIDADTTVITSVSLINSPPFVPMVAIAMKNRNVLVIGLSVGIVGYAAGNYLGFLMYHLLLAL